jgi:putative N6-adenine-specific DNA methylase
MLWGDGGWMLVDGHKPKLSSRSTLMMAAPLSSIHRNVAVLCLVAAAFCNRKGSALCGRTNTPFVHRHHPSTSSLTAVVHDDWYIDDDVNDGGNEHSDLSRENIFANTDRDSRYERQDLPKEVSPINNADKDIRFYFATCIPGLHEVLANELISFGASNVETQGTSGVSFEGSPKVGLKTILWCRTAHKVMELIASSSDGGNGYENDYSEGIRTSNDLYQFTKSAIHTPSLLGNGAGGLLTLSVSTTYTSKVPKELCHSHYSALTVKNSLVDAVRELRDDGERPDVDVIDADVPLVVVIRGRRIDNGRRTDWRQRDRNQHYAANFEAEEEQTLVADVDIYRCLHAGGSAHRRGYRKMPSEDSGDAVIHRAAMKESLAAGLLLQAGWDKLVNAARGDGKGAVLIDPMTGSATLPVEAALIACDMAPGLSRIASWRSGGDGSRNPHRYPPAIRWKDFSDLETWDKLLNDAKSRAMAGMKFASSMMGNGQNNVSIYCNEKNPGAALLAISSIKNAGVSRIVSLSEGDCIDWNLENGGGISCAIPSRTIFVANPPWGKRLSQDIDDSWVNLREFIRQEASGCEVWVLSGNKDLTKILRMKKSKSLAIRTADEELKWLQYHVFKKSEVSV